MAKTVRLSEETHKILEMLREEEKVKSYDQLIQRLIVRSGVISGFGKDPQLPKWKEEKDRAKFRGE